MNVRILLFLFFGFMLVIVFSNYVVGQAIVGVSPGTHTYKNVLRGGYAERPFTITSSTEDDILVRAQVFGVISDWINFSENVSGVSKNNVWRPIVSVSPPADIPNGNYSGIMRIQSFDIGGAAPEGHASGNIVPVLDVFITVEITDVEIIQCSASGFNVQSVEKGDDLNFDVNVDNSGNVRLKPRIRVDIWDKEEISIVESFDQVGDEILPTREEKVSFEYSTDDLDEDQYWAEISVIECLATEILTFDVFEPGALKANGVFRKIIGPTNVEVDDTVSLFALFENIGEKEVNAQFKGQISLGDKIVQLIEGDRFDVPIAQIANFTFFFTPEKEGRYIISGRVYYDNKLTAQKSTIVNVIPKKIMIKSYLLTAIYIVIILIVGFLFFKIRKERRRYYGKA